MFKILTLIVLSWLAYRLFVAPQKQINTGEMNAQEPDEFVDYEEIKDEE